jgi:hypothetical protein
VFDIILFLAHPQEYKCHKSNGVVFCFWKARVFVSCMDSECRRALTLHRNAYYVLARELEEDIFARGSSLETSPATFANSPCASAGACGSPASSSATCTLTGAGLSNSAIDIHSYRLSSDYVQSVLSQSQIEFLEELRKQKQDLIREYLLEQGGVGQPAKRLHLRKISKVPWRCVIVPWTLRVV